MAAAAAATMPGADGAWVEWPATQFNNSVKRVASHSEIGGPRFQSRMRRRHLLRFFPRPCDHRPTPRRHTQEDKGGTIYLRILGQISTEANHPNLLFGFYYPSRATIGNCNMVSSLPPQKKLDCVRGPRGRKELLGRSAPARWQFSRPFT